MKTNNQHKTLTLGISKSFGKKNEYLSQVYIYIYEHNNTYKMRVTDQFTKIDLNKKSKILSSISIEEIKDPESLMQAISNLGLEKLNDHYINNESNYSGSCIINYNNINITVSNGIIVEEIEKLKELINFNAIMRNINIRILNELDDNNDKLAYAINQNIFDITSELSHKEQINSLVLNR